MKQYLLVCQYLAKFFLEKEMFQTKFVEKNETHFVISNIFFRKSVQSWDNVENYVRTGQATDCSRLRRRKDTICMPSN